MPPKRRRLDSDDEPVEADRQVIVVHDDDPEYDPEDDPADDPADDPEDDLDYEPEDDLDDESDDDEVDGDSDNESDGDLDDEVIVSERQQLVNGLKRDIYRLQAKLGNIAAVCDPIRAQIVATGYTKLVQKMNKLRARIESKAGELQVAREARDARN